ncbi:hypothetical protein CLV51_106176 [Chitinophaga niastensis]|uniref:Uncharacterized protein n=1 Tax=Chitinophaga niastensis TaxID=536980 RepID=A0A2P8HDK5_CHINA|nr:hypothetical protein [Chitinophaga niastensis]PSL44310.1 hypothetical protein CLV51_106176 [Chitinophaga niastensis]
MNQNDERLQEWLDKGGQGVFGDVSSQDIESYRFLFEKLKESPSEGLPYNFSSKLTARLKEKVYRKSNLRFYISTVAIFIVGLTLSYGCMLVVNQRYANELLAAVWGYKWVCVLALICVLTVQWVDNELLRDGSQN